MYHCGRVNFNQKWTFGIVENEWQIALISGNASFLAEWWLENLRREL